MFLKDIYGFEEDLEGSLWISVLILKDLCLQLPQSGQFAVAEGADLVVLHVEQAELAAVAQVGQAAQPVALQLTEREGNQGGAKRPKRCCKMEEGKIEPID